MPPRHHRRLCGGATGAGFSSSQSCPAGHTTPVFRFFVCISVSLKFVHLCFMNQPLTSHASGLDSCQCTRTRPDFLLFLFLGSQLSLTRISRPASFLLLSLNIVASRTCFICFFCCSMSHSDLMFAELIKYKVDRSRLISSDPLPADSGLRAGENILHGKKYLLFLLYYKEFTSRARKL